jgi:hypothetical protein
MIPPPLRGDRTMNREEEIQTAWTLWHLIAKLNELIWDRYEDDFIKQYLKIEEQKDGDNQSKMDLLWEAE